MKVLLRLSGKTHNESRAKADARDTGADAVDEVLDVLASSLAAHEGEHFSVDVLKGHIDIACRMGIAGDRGNEIVTPVGGVGVKKSHPELPADLSDLIEKMNERGATGGIDRLAGPRLLLP